MTNEIHHHHFCGNSGDVHCMTHKERANKRLAMAEDLFSLCRHQTAKEWQECLEIAWKVIK